MGSRGVLRALPGLRVRMRGRGGERGLGRALGPRAHDVERAFARGLRHSALGARSIAAPPYRGAGGGGARRARRAALARALPLRHERLLFRSSACPASWSARCFAVSSGGGTRPCTAPARSARRTAPSCLPRSRRSTSAPSPTSRSYAAPTRRGRCRTRRRSSSWKRTRRAREPSAACTSRTGT